MMKILEPKFVVRFLIGFLIFSFLVRVLGPVIQERESRAAEPTQRQDCKAVLALINCYKDDHKGAFPAKLADLEYLIRNREIAPPNLTSIDDLAGRYLYFPPKPEQLERRRLSEVLVLYQHGRYYKGANNRCIAFANGQVRWTSFPGAKETLRQDGIDTAGLE